MTKAERELLMVLAEITMRHLSDNDTDYWAIKSAVRDLEEEDEDYQEPPDPND